VDKKESIVSNDVSKDTISEINTLIDQNRILNDRITALENEPHDFVETNYDRRISKLENITFQYGLKISEQSIIREHVPFKVELMGAKEQGSWTYLFKENGFFDFHGIGGSYSDAATYKLDRKNNTIMINSDQPD